MTCDIIEPQGFVEIFIKDIVTQEIIYKDKKNTVLSLGKQLLARSLANNVNAPYDFFINRMVFGTGGEDGEIPRTVDSGRTSLFNEVLEISVSSSWDTDFPTQVKFTGTIESSSANGFTLNEAALKSSSGDLFSMVTFPGLSKTNQLQFTLNWTILFA